MDLKNTENEIFFNFSYFAMKLLGKGLYSNAWTAIAELVANGFDAEASNVYILLDMRNKQSATIEIFDNGYGMGYQDLAEKYVMIGKNKRQNDELDEEIKKEVMGRKGVGKLAALYLSNKFYITSKTNTGYASSWYLDLKSANDSDIPKLKRAKLAEVNALSSKVWDELDTGTMIKLTNVNLTNIGFYTIEGLKANLADFYLMDELNKNIYISVLNYDDNEINFEQIHKNIAFKNMYAFFYTENSKQYLENLSEDVFIGNSNIEHIDNKKRNVQILKPESFTIKGVKEFVNEFDEKVKLPYELKGWIGIHSSIELQTANKNDNRFMKNKARKPTRLRLYIRKKLAVDNFLDILNNHQAMANYIEGEISFDILDDDNLPDITTSNRQDIAQDNDRLVVLKELLNPIINTLIRERNKIGATINGELKDYKDKLENEAKKKQQEADSKRKQAEEKQKKAEEEKKQAEKDRKRAEEDKKKAEEEKKQAEEEMNAERKKNAFFNQLITDEDKNFAKRFHLVKTNNDTIKRAINNLLKEQKNNTLNKEKLENKLKTMSFCSEKITTLLYYGINADFDTENEQLFGDMFKFIEEYCIGVLKERGSIKIVVNNNGIVYDRRFSPQNIGVILENVYSNSLKNNATILTINLYKNNKNYLIEISDNGKGLSAAARANINTLFDFGKGYTMPGSGIGLYHIQEIVKKKMKGNVSIDQEYVNGFCLHIGFENERCN